MQTSWALLLLVALFSIAHAQPSTYNLTLFFGGGLPFCSQCGEAGAYSCSPYGNVKSIGNWNNGTLEFNNPLPKGVFASSITATVYGSYGCSQSGSVAVFSVSLNGNVLDIQQGSSPTTCKCNTCEGGVVFSGETNLFNELTYGYNYNNPNLIQVYAYNEVICVNRIEVVITSSKNAPQIDYWQGSFSPSRSDCTQPCGVPRKCWNSDLVGSQVVQFNDPLPENSLLLAAAVQVFGSSRFGPSSQNISAALVGQFVGSAPCNFATGFCGGNVYLSTDSFFQDGWPGYAYGGQNSLTLSIEADYIMVGTFVLQLYYYGGANVSTVAVALN